MEKFLVFLLLFILGCESEPKYLDSDLVGIWKSIEWRDITNDKEINIKVKFEFEPENRYLGAYNKSFEKGEYWVSGVYLYTIEDGKAEKKVKIEKLSKDTLILGMNRAGVLEQIKLIRRK